MPALLCRDSLTPRVDPLRPQARAAMLAAMEAPGNASSVHAEGRAAKAAIEQARTVIARGLGTAARTDQQSQFLRSEFPGVLPGPVGVAKRLNGAKIRPVIGAK